ACPGTHITERKFIMGIHRFLGQFFSNPRTEKRKTRRLRTNSRKLWLEALEDRTLPAVTLLGAPDWSPQGPGPITPATPCTQLEEGAANGIAADPFNADVIFLSTTNGGVWRTTNATAASPTWTPLTDQYPSLSMGACAISPLDSTGAMRTASTPLA